ncbi:unnamed protein product [Phytophthora lilii]|uniref:Unnamed protein product n=1 Tax=Phytophthora lilii TaxID=2077276 RepID=A0A9W6WQR0_9STRA|nr:unnamed protein product [Phytophthora lilii]
MEPWVLSKTLKKSDDSASEEYQLAKERLDTVLFWLVGLIVSLSNLAILLQPVVPKAAAKILDYLGVSADKRSFADATLLKNDENLMGAVLENSKSFVTFPKFHKQRD